jgi:hypothetical protein
MALLFCQRFTSTKSHATNTPLTKQQPESQMIQFETITGPAYWASYLINNDASGIEADEKARADAWIKRNNVANVVDCEEESRFTNHYQLYDPLADCTGGDVLDYTCEVTQ